MLELIDVSKVYRGGRRAVDHMTLRLGPGLLGLLGPNGAGKSSLMRMAATVTPPTGGRILYDGVDAVARPDVLRQALGYLPQDFGVYPHLTAREFLAYLAAAKGISARAARARIDELLELVNLTEAAGRPLGGYSGGMLRRVGIAQTLLADPRVLVVDEPTAGLDPQERVRFRNLVRARGHGAGRARPAGPVRRGGRLGRGRRLGRRRALRPVAGSGPGHAQPQPPALPGRLRPAVVRDRQWSAAARLHGRGPDRRPSGRPARSGRRRAVRAVARRRLRGRCGAGRQGLSRRQARVCRQRGRPAASGVWCRGHLPAVAEGGSQGGASSSYWALRSICR
ncbi:ATP-binding cassette domain-containing protein [Streptomyces sp. NPDC059679]|uniref:ATP-binding cassette domain-containing protein n=1 Tax=Streptomyces sp. NPDC059679 TaxID=3346903 RepID=UPI003684B5D9